MLATELRHDPESLLHHAVRANIRAAANQLRHGSEIIEQLIRVCRRLQKPLLDFARFHTGVFMPPAKAAICGKTLVQS